MYVGTRGIAPLGKLKLDSGTDWRYAPDACCVNDIVGVYFLTPILLPKLLFTLEPELSEKQQKESTK